MTFSTNGEESNLYEINQQDMDIKKIIPELQHRKIITSIRTEAKTIKQILKSVRLNSIVRKAFYDQII